MILLVDVHTKYREKVAVYSNFIVIVFEIPALSVEKMRKLQLEGLFSVLKRNATN